jgi:AhpD family alkylhydroperoxidase
VLAADAVLVAGTLTRREQEIIKLVISGAGGCDYCVTARNYLAQLAGVKPNALKQTGDGKPTADAKRDALVRFVRKLA